jgi:hypothetical protein
LLRPVLATIYATVQLRRSVAYTYNGYVLNIYSNAYRAGHGGWRATADHGEAGRTGGYVFYCILLVYGNGGEEQDGG